MRKVYKYLFLLFIISLSFTGIGLSNFLIPNYSTIENNINIVDENIEYSNVNVAYKYYDSKEMIEEPSTIKYISDSNNDGVADDGFVSISGDKQTNNEFNEMKNYLQTYYQTLITEFSEFGKKPPTFETIDVSFESGVYSNFYKINEDNGNEIYFVFEVNNELRYEAKNRLLYETYSYSGSYRMYTVEYSSNFNVSDVPNAQISTLKIIKGNTINSNRIIYNNEDIPLDDYYFIGFYLTDSSFSTLASYFSLDTKITEDNIYLVALFNKTGTEASASLYDISNIINSNNGTLSIYKGSSNANVLNDYTFETSSNSFSLGNKNKTVHIDSGETVNFALNTGETYHENTPANSQNDTIVEPIGNKSLEYKVVLQNDLYIDGTLNIGASYGSGNNSTNQQGTIHSAYVLLDLNGHNIYLNSGASLNAYGLIINSKDTGMIYNKGGNILTLAVVHDYKGGDNASSMAASDKNFPFIFYQLPYLRAKIKFQFDDNNNFGNLSGLVKIFVGSLNIAGIYEPQFSNVTLKFIGSGNDAFFHVSKKSNETSEPYIIFNTYLPDIAETKTNDFSNTGSFKNDYNYDTLYRTRWEINNLSFRIEALLLTLKFVIDIKVDTSEFNFPISSTFDIILNNSDGYIEQAIQFLPGCSFIVDKRSNLLLGFNENRAAEISVCGESPNHYSYNKNVFIDNYKDSTVSSNEYASHFLNSKILWKYYGMPKVFIYGNLYFKKGSSYNYKIAGEINVNKIGYYTNSIGDGELYNLKTDDVFSKLQSSGVNVITYGYDYIPFTADYHLKTYARPFISNGISYIHDLESYQTTMVGSFDKQTGILSMNNNLYYFNIDNSSFQSTNKSLNIKECTYDSNTHLITDITTGNQYVYFSECAFLVLGSSGSEYTIQTIRVNNSTTSVVVTYKQDLKQWTKK